jgi:hypothetical protein
MPELTIPLFLTEGQILEPIEDESLLTLPVNFYAKATRPEYIKVTAKSTFDVIAGEYGKAKVYDVNIAWTDLVCNVNVTSKYSAHTIATAATGLTDEADIVIENVAEAIDVSDNSENIAYINGVEYACNFVNGVANIIYDYAGQERAMAVSISINNNTYFPSLNVPGNIKALADLRAERDAKLKSCDWLVIRHSSQDNKTLSDSQYAELQNYMQALRDLPATADLSNITWPTKPSFI